MNGVRIESHGPIEREPRFIFVPELAVNCCQDDGYRDDSCSCKLLGLRERRVIVLPAVTHTLLGVRSNRG